MADLQGKHVAVTGATSGIGRAAAIALAGMGARLTLLCRDEARGAELCQEMVAGELPEPQLVIMDMASLASVRSAGQRLLAEGAPIDVLLNNAGIVNTHRRVTEDGFEETLAVNHLAPFLLTGLLLPLLANRQGRVVNVSSDAHKFVDAMGFGDMQAENGYRTFREYGRSKGANILFTRQLAAHRNDITVNALHPGAVATSLATQNKGVSARLLPKLLKPFFRSPEQGAQTSVYLCSDVAVGSVSGEYFAKCRVARTKPWARDSLAAQQLWDYSEQAVGFSYS